MSSRKAISLMALTLLTCAGCSGRLLQPPSTATPHAVLRVAGFGGKFAGYQWLGPFTSMQGSWRVPRLRSETQTGRASTWIGAEGSGASANEPFIQVGTQEELEPPSRPGGRPVRFFAAFWSDTHRDYRPTFLASADPGDRVSASLELRDHVWTISFDDLTTSTTTTITTSDEGTARFDDAQWLQEDVSRASNDQPFPYPRLTPVRWSELRINFRRPDDRSLQSVWMSLPGGYIGPAGVTRGVFSIGPRMLTAAAARYLRVAIPADRAADRFSAELDSWTAATAQSTVERESDRFARALNAAEPVLAGRDWPGALLRRIHGLAADNRFDAQALTKTAAASGERGVTALVRGAGLDFDDEYEAEPVRTGLGLPGFNH